MSQQLFYSTKSTGTYADTLAAFGLAEIIKGILEHSGGRAWSGERIEFRDDGPYYVIELSKPLPENWVERCEYFNPAQPISTPKQKWDGKAKARDYDSEWKHFKQYQDTVKNLREAARKVGIEANLPDPPPPDFWVLAFLGDYRMQALNGYNEAIHQWEETKNFFVQNIETILELSATPYPDVEAISKGWAKSVTQKGIKRERRVSQLFNPVQGEGQHHPKANRLNTRNWVESFWLLEFLKGVGLWKCAIPRTVSGDDDRKTYVVSPKRISLAAHEDVFVKFGAALWNETAVKMDVVAALLYAQTLIDYSEQKRQIEGRVPDKVIEGLYVTTYKRLSQNSYTVMNLAFIGIPEWTGEISNRENAKSAQEVINEHIQIIKSVRTINEKGKNLERDEIYKLLADYRDFLSGRQLGAFFDFCAGYSQYLARELKEKHYWIKPFTFNNLRRLFMGIDQGLSEIIDNEGFRRIASAIRRSTITPLYLGDKSMYEVRYGLGMELKRKAAFPKEFLGALSDFLQTYNEENARKSAKSGQQMRSNYREEDLTQVVHLVDKFGSEIVCHLLIALGYASESDDDKSAKNADK